MSEADDLLRRLVEYTERLGTTYHKKCAECRPGGAWVEPEYRCPYHAARDYLARPPAPVRTIDIQPGDVVWLGEWRSAEPDDAGEMRYALVWRADFLRPVVKVLNIRPRDGKWWTGHGGVPFDTIDDAQAAAEKFVVEMWARKP